MMLAKNFQRAFCAWLALGQAFLLVPMARACSICGCGDPLAAAGDNQPVAGRLVLDLGGEYLSAQATSDDDPSKTESLTQFTLRPQVVYSLSNSLNLVLQVPLVSKSWKLTGGPHPDASANPQGLGDLDLGARMFVFSKVDLGARSSQQVALSFGSTLPTGADTITDSLGQRLDQHAQLGTGAFGPYAGLLYSYHVGVWGLGANLYGHTHSVNSFDYAFGNALTGGLGGRLDLLDSLSVSLAVEGRYAEKDVSQGLAQDNTGGTVLDLSPSLSYNPWAELWLSAKLQLPFYTNLFGTQSLGSTFLVSTRYNFNLL